MPAQFLESPRGVILADAYDELIRAAGDSSERIASAMNDVIVELIPVAALMHQWQLEGASLFAHGLALVRKDS